VKTLLVITGPQGSGNHLFSKIFALSPEVSGWSALLDTYWIGHDQEPFAECWKNPALLLDKDFSTHDYWVTSISCPYADHGVLTIPKYQEFIDAATSFGIQVKLAIIGRDRNILEHQQNRVRGRVSLPDFEEQLPYLTGIDPIYISQELLYLYGANYVESIAKQLNFPIEIDERFDIIIIDDANTKYFVSAEIQELDAIVKSASGLPN